MHITYIYRYKIYKHTIYIGNNYGFIGSYSKTKQNNQLSL